MLKLLLDSLLMILPFLEQGLSRSSNFFLHLIRIWPLSSTLRAFEHPNKQEQEKIHKDAGIKKHSTRNCFVSSMENLWLDNQTCYIVNSKLLIKLQTTVIMSSLHDITLLLQNFHDLENNNTEIDPLHYDFDHHVDDLNRR